jgi:hypothetical protein
VRNGALEVIGVFDWIQKGKFTASKGSQSIEGLMVKGGLRGFNGSFNEIRKVCKFKAAIVR